MISEEYYKDLFANLAGLWDFFMVLLFIPPLFRLISNITIEKQAKVRELMRIMGLTDLPYWLAWYLYYLIVMTVICLVMTLILIPCFANSNKFLVFLYLWCFGMSLYGFGVLVTAFFSNGLAAAILGSLVHYFAGWMVLFCQDKFASPVLKIFFSFIPQVAVQLGSPILFDFETSGIGVTFSNVFD